MVEKHSGLLHRLLPDDQTTCFASTMTAVSSAPLRSSATFFTVSQPLRRCVAAQPFSIRHCQYVHNAAGKWGSLRQCHLRLPLQSEPPTAPPRPPCWAAMTWTWTSSPRAASSAQAQLPKPPPLLLPHLQGSQQAPLLSRHRHSQVGRVTGRVIWLNVVHLVQEHRGCLVLG